MQNSLKIKNKAHEKVIEAKNRVTSIIDAVDPERLVDIIKQTPSLRGMVTGYLSEEMFEKHILEDNNKIDDIRSHDDHNRKFNKIDRDFIYNERRYGIQIKSIQTNSVCWRSDLNCLVADVQNDGSDKRTVHLPNGNAIQTTNYKIGEYDILAVPLFPFTGEWNYAYKKNKDCRRTQSSKYTKDDRQYILASTEQIHYPLRNEWTTDLLSLCDNLDGATIKAINPKFDNHLFKMR